MIDCPAKWHFIATLMRCLTGKRDQCHKASASHNKETHHIKQILLTQPQAFEETTGTLKCSQPLLLMRWWLHAKATRGPFHTPTPNPEIPAQQLKLTAVAPCQARPSQTPPPPSAQHFSASLPVHPFQIELKLYGHSEPEKSEEKINSKSHIQM